MQLLKQPGQTNAQAQCLPQPQAAVLLYPLLQRFSRAPFHDEHALSLPDKALLQRWDSAILYPAQKRPFPLAVRKRHTGMYDLRRKQLLIPPAAHQKHLRSAAFPAHVKYLVTARYDSFGHTYSCHYLFVCCGSNLRRTRK